MNYSLNRFIRIEYHIQRIQYTYQKKNFTYCDSFGSHRELSLDCDLDSVMSWDLDCLMGMGAWLGVAKVSCILCHQGV